ncbi:MAG: type II toxin-antitoxin system RelE/ParE family toxin [Bacteroidetes bacterium]|nr:type II toxin-antitoxin system RelE/ParE family toxin [Bacteroidota bacterium]
MKVEFDESFEKSIKKLKDAKIKAKLIDLIDVLEEVDTVQALPNIKKMQGFQSFYRIRIGDYRLGFELIDASTILLIMIAHRKEIYRYFP